MSINLQLDDKALNKLLNSPKGPVGKHLRVIAQKILTEAKTMVGVRTGALKRSLTVRQGARGNVQFVSVGSNLPHALMHHEGTRPHEIRALPGRVMRFNVGGRVVYAQRVDHPGTRPRKYLTVPMNRHVR